MISGAGRVSASSSDSSRNQVTSRLALSLVYEVQVDRARCSQIFGPIYDCEDTGERLEMRILVDTTENRWDVPDGGQKGVITMYPLEGGDGVVVVQPNWTMAPPWVSGNVPIN